MSTITEKAQVRAHAQAVSRQKSESTLWKKAEEARYGIIPLLLTLVACLGGVAAAFGVGDSVAQLSMVVFPTMMCLSFILAVGPMKLIMWSGLVAVILDITVLFF